MVRFLADFAVFYMFFPIILPDFMDLLKIHGSATAQNIQSPVEIMSSSHNTYAKEIPGKNVIKVLSIIYMYLYNNIIIILR